MSVKYILQQFGNKVGLNPSQTNQRATMLRFVNEAARELYDQSDMVGSQMEQLFKINGDQTISFPTYVGELRAVRPWDTETPWHINQMRPRYNQINWPDKWRNYRIKNKHPLHTSVRNESLVTFTVHAVENPPVEITIAGPTENSDRTSEIVVMDAVTKSTVNAYVDVELLEKNRVNSYNISVTDVDGLELAVMGNNRLKSEYLHVDVSTFPYLNNNGGGNAAHWMETLYKKALPYLSADSDEFPAVGFDDVIVNKAIQLYYEIQEKPDLAALYDGKASRTMARKNENENAATEDCIALVPNPHDTLIQPIRPQRPGYWPRIGPY